jgi:hypothetical protein
MVSTIEHQLKKKNKVSGLYLDLQKAFDSVWHSGLLYRLAECGNTGRILYTINYFLVNRRIKLKINSHISPESECPIGLPQGSVLSPLLFILYTRDLLQNIRGLALQFADDCSVISWAEDDHTHQRMVTENCDVISSWLNRWQMAANCQKTDLIIFEGSLETPSIQQTAVQVAMST